MSLAVEYLKPDNPGQESVEIPGQTRKKHNKGWIRNCPATNPNEINYKSGLGVLQNE